MPNTIKGVGIERADLLASLAAEIWAEHYTPIIGAAQVRYMLERFQSASAISTQIEEGYQYFLIQDGTEPAGYLAFCFEGETLFLSKFYIRAEARGKGLGREAMQFIEALARQNGMKEMTLTVNKHNARSIAAYEALGFENIGSLVTDIGGGFVMDDYKLKRKL